LEKRLADVFLPSQLCVSVITARTGWMVDHRRKPVLEALDSGFENHEQQGTQAGNLARRGVLEWRPNSIRS
jgi:hypothetical protein